MNPVKNIATLPVTIITTVTKCVVYSVLFVATSIATTAFVNGCSKACFNKELTKDVFGTKHIYKYSYKLGETTTGSIKKIHNKLHSD